MHIDSGKHGLKVRQYPDKTFVGYLSRGFECLGAHFSVDGLVGKPLSVASCG